MVRKQLDSRIPDLITNGVKKNHRSFFVLVGDKGRDQVVNLHFLLSQSRVSSRPNVLWCYKKELGFTSHRKKREAKIKRDVQRGIREPNEQNPFELFVSVTDIRYTYYKDSHKILGNTYGMLVLQDFEAITPNLLARTIETVEGEAHTDVVARFNERFILSLGSCDDCLVLDDELNVLPISNGKNIVAIEDDAQNQGKGKGKRAEELKGIKESLEDVQPVGSVVKYAKTVDQAKAVLTFVEAIADKTLSSTVTLTASRGRGKSSALGLSIAAAVAHGYSNIFVTSPSPENLTTLFEFIFKGLDGLGYEEHLDYDIVQSTNPDFNKAIVRVNIFRQHRQTIQYIQPQDAHVLGQAELVIIDEAAAIPLPLVRNLIGPYLVFMASTINGYEGTGRSLSLKLIQQLRESTRPIMTKQHLDQDQVSTKKVKTSGGAAGPGSGPGTGISRQLREINLDEPIRYGQGDKVEKWLHGVLCLDASVVSKVVQGCPHPDQCELFAVNRDTLFSYNPASEVFLQRMMALYVASHYKNSPNDLQLMSDAPAHQLFVLLPPLKGDETTLPDPLVVIQVALEGNISKQSILQSLNRGMRSGGDLIPWLVAQQFQDDDFAMLSGARIVRIATHPDYASMGYGARALECLNQYYSGDLLNLNESGPTPVSDMSARDKIDPNTNIHTDRIAIREAKSMPPLLERLSERQPENLDYLGVSYGLTPNLLRFWKRSGYTPLYVRQTANDLTGEHTCVMIKALDSQVAESDGWLSEFAHDFRKRFIALLSFKFREFASITALSILEAANGGDKVDRKDVIDVKELRRLFTPFDLKRLESYANNMLDYHVILDLLPTIAGLYFAQRLPADVKLSAVQSSILLALGLQRKSIEDVETELTLPVSQALALFVKVMRKISSSLQSIQKDAIGAEIPEQETADVVKNVGQPLIEGEEVARADWKPMERTVEQDLADAGDEVTRKMKEKQREIINSMDLAKYAIDDKTDWAAAEAHVSALAGNKGAKKDMHTVSETTARDDEAYVPPASEPTERELEGGAGGEYPEYETNVDAVKEDKEVEKAGEKIGRDELSSLSTSNILPSSNTGNGGVQTRGKLIDAFAQEKEIDKQIVENDIDD
uniref:RNA cytidine acetyltransferase n=1 Tax=Bartheletia paradoxa TaxID=669517 RepID=A0A2D0XI13_9BASI|nr:hypothetical protein SPAR01368 [Bartheletia paradoxa]